jgi:hypothetical protein
MERRDLFGLPLVACVPGTALPTPAEKVRERWTGPAISDELQELLISHYLKTPEGRQKLLESAEVGLKGDPEKLQEIRERIRAAESLV